MNSSRLTLLFCLLFFTILYSCKKDELPDNKKPGPTIHTDTTGQDTTGHGTSGNNMHIQGTYIGTHKIQNISAALLEALEKSLPFDPETGAPYPLTEGFKDTFRVSVSNDTVKIVSSRFKTTLTGLVTGNNRFIISQQEIPEVIFTPGTVLENLTIKSSSEIAISSGSYETEISMNFQTNIQEIQTGDNIFPPSLTINTSGNFKRLK